MRHLITENKRQKELKVHLPCTFIRIYPDEKDFSDYDGLVKIQPFLDGSKDEEFKKTERKN